MIKKWSFVFGFILSILIFRDCFAQEIFEESKGLYSTDELSTSMTLVGNNKLVIKSATALGGMLKIEAVDTDEITVSYYKKARTPSKSRAIDYIDLIAVSLQRIPDGVQLEWRAPFPAPWKNMEAGLVMATVSLPESCFIEIDVANYDVEAVGPFTGFVMPSSLGRVDVSDVSGELDVNTANRRVSVENISGKISISTSNATLAATGIQCGEQQAIIRNNGGDIRIDDFKGSLNVRNSYGRIEIYEFIPIGTKNFIRGLSEPIILEIIEIDSGQVVINNRYEDIEISIPEDISASLSLSVEEGNKIEVLNFPFKPEIVQSNRLNLIAGKGLSLIRGAVTGRGNIYMRGFETGD